MPIHYKISTHIDIAYAKWVGRTKLLEFREMFGAYLEDENYLPGRAQLCDFSKFKDMSANIQQIWSILSMVNKSDEHGFSEAKCIIYAPNDIAFGFARMYQSLAENQGGLNVTICDNEGEALQALNLKYRSINDLLKYGQFH